MKQSYHHGELRASAIAEAIELIQKKKEVNFTLREISKLIKVSHTALYRHFNSKQSLLVAIAEEGFKELNSRFLKAEKSKADSLDKLGFEYIYFAFERPGQFRAMFHQDLRCGLELPESFVVKSEECYVYLQKAIGNSKSKRLLRVSLEESARSMWALVHGFAQLLIDGQFPELTTNLRIKKAIKAHIKLLTL